MLDKFGMLVHHDFRFTKLIVSSCYSFDYLMSSKMLQTEIVRGCFKIVVTHMI